jgi:hypothetical protein
MTVAPDPLAGTQFCHIGSVPEETGSDQPE